jgi:hypothetical protein
VMHGHEKSDSAIAAVKPAKKGGIFCTFLLCLRVVSLANETPGSVVPTPNRLSWKSGGMSRRWRIFRKFPDSVLFLQRLGHFSETATV